MSAKLDANALVAVMQQDLAQATACTDALAGQNFDAVLAAPNAKGSDLQSWVSKTGYPNLKVDKDVANYSLHTKRIFLADAHETPVGSGTFSATLFLDLGVGRVGNEAAALKPRVIGPVILNTAAGKIVTCAASSAGPGLPCKGASIFRSGGACGSVGLRAAGRDAGSCPCPTARRARRAARSA